MMRSSHRTLNQHARDERASNERTRAESTPREAAERVADRTIIRGAVMLHDRDEAGAIDRSGERLAATLDTMGIDRFAMEDSEIARTCTDVAIAIADVRDPATFAAELRASGLDRLLAESIASDRPVVAVGGGFVTLTLLFDDFPVRAVRAGIDVLRGSQMLRPRGLTRAFPTAEAWFDGRHALEPVEPIDASWHVATVAGRSSRIAGLARGRFLGCLFRPECSGSIGRRILKRFITDARHEHDAAIASLRGRSVA